MQPICDVARRHGLKVIEDAAQAHGARYRSRRAGRLGDAAGLQLLPRQEPRRLRATAGAVVTDDDELAAGCGCCATTARRSSTTTRSRGRNARLDALQAAVLRVKLARLDEWNHASQAIAAERYLKALSRVALLVLPHVPDDVEPAWHLFVVRHPRRDDLQRHLSQAGVETLIHYPIPPHRSGAYADRGFRDGDFPLTERIAASLLSLPMGPHLTPAMQERVLEAVASFPD